MTNDRRSTRPHRPPGAEPEGITDGELNRRVSSRDRPNLSEAIGKAMDRGWIERSGGEILPAS